MLMTAVGEAQDSRITPEGNTSLRSTYFSPNSLVLLPQTLHTVDLNLLYRRTITTKTFFVNLVYLHCEFWPEI